MTADRAVVLLSGGLDSTTCLALAQSRGRECFALTVAYGQRHSAELDAARRVAEVHGVAEHRIIDVDFGQFGGSALTDLSIEVPRDRGADAGTVPVTYVPARNTIFLSLALAWAEIVGAGEIWIGVNAVDYSGYPDCRPEYIEAFSRMANLATKVGVEDGAAPQIVTPLVDLSKADIIRLGKGIGVDYSMTLSCYDPDVDGVACGHCEACRLRAAGFAEAGQT
ncbi:MAG: 7-cyano-7-deazaguanine synthase QueC [Planctomycetes bacterium]|nr:7-cyano-7-deazaguanine synthase QueC [Planctomycetota bacterium]MDP6424791.1 7-cyano-7-deazaguanine synthase QueC [Planctomycetota bacterium]